jgi:hypothetical protein
MSDSFGPTSLDADLPGLGPQTGNVRGPPVQLPSALQGLAKHFMGQQSPAPGQPKPLPPKPKQAQMGSTDPPIADARSFAPVPANAPQPPPKFTPFIKSMPREPDQWGKPEPYPRLPQSFELPGIYQQLGGYFAQSGSFRSAPLGAGMAAYSVAYQDAYQKGMDRKMKQSVEQLQLHSVQLEELERRQTVEYGDIYSQYSAMGGQSVGGVNLHDAVWRKAVELGDKNVIAMMEGGASAEKVRRYLMEHEARVNDLGKANSKVAEQDAKDRKEWGVPDDDADPATRTDPPPPIDAPPRGQPNAPDAPAPPGASQPETQKDRVDALPRYQRAGLEYLRGGSLEGVPKGAKDAAVRYADGIAGQMDDLAAKARAGGMSKEQIEDGLRAINPAIAGEFADIRDLNTPLPGGMGAINAKPFWRDIQTLAAASVPGWRAADYQNISDMQKDYTTGTSSRRMQAANNMADTAIPLLKALKDIPEGTAPPENWISQIAAKKFTGDPKWIRLYNALQPYVQESQSLASPTGRYFEGDVNRLMHEFDIAQGPRAIRAVLATDAEAGSRRIQTLTDDYQNTTHKQFPPHYNPKSTAIMNAIAKLDPDKGFEGQTNLPPDLQGLGMGVGTTPGAAAGPQPGGLPPGWSVSPVQ